MLYFFHKSCPIESRVRSFNNSPKCMIKIFLESDKFSHKARVTEHATNRLARKSQNSCQSGDNRSMLDYLMVRKTDCCLVKVISSKECVPLHLIVIGRLVIPINPQKKIIVKFVPKPRVWKLKDEETSRLFTHEMAARNDEVTKADATHKK